MTNQVNTTWTPEAIIALLATSAYAVERALLALYARQTADEQVTHQTREHNGVGFSGCDAEFFSSLAVQIQANKYGKPNGQRLSPGQLACCRKLNKAGKMKIARYARQLAEIANERKVMAA